MGEKNVYSVKHLATGIILECSSDKTLFIFNIENGSSTTFDAWSNQVKLLLENWPPQRPCLLLYDFHKMGKIGLNKSLYEHFETLYRTCPNLKRYTAIVMPNNLNTEETQLAFQLERLRVSPSYPAQWKAFTSRMEAMQWLLAHENAFRQEMNN